jgi:hypothetical protein
MKKECRRKWKKARENTPENRSKGWKEGMKGKEKGEK